MGQHPSTAPFDFDDYWPVYKDPEAVAELFGRIQKASAEATEADKKSDLDLMLKVLQLRQLEDQGATSYERVKQVEAALADKKLLESGSADWESNLYVVAARAYRDNAQPELAVELYQRAAVARAIWFSTNGSRIAANNWQSAARIALDDLRQPDLALQLAQRAVGYLYRWADKWEDQEAWCKAARLCLVILADALQQSGKPQDAAKIRQQHDTLKFPSAPKSLELQLQYIVENVGRTADPVLNEWLSYCNVKFDTTPDNDARSLWKAATYMVEAQLQPDPAIAMQLCRSHLKRFEEYGISTMLVAAYQQAAQIAHQAKLSELEQKYLAGIADCYEKLYGEEDRLTILARAARANGPLERHQKGALASTMRELWELAQREHSEDQELQSQLRAMAPAEVLLDGMAGEISPERKRMLDEALGQLEAMVGIDQVKQQIQALSDFMAVQQRRQAAGEQLSRRANHFVFSGPPGTGKTTVARLLGKILYALEQLPSDKLTEVTPSELIAGYIGQTAIKTREVIERARGGVLFIDEAYQIGGTETGSDHKGYGGEALAELIGAMENQRDSLTVVFAGYEAEMSRFLDVNPGLASRISEQIDFPAYDTDELVEIFTSIATKAGYSLDPGAQRTLPGIAQSMKQSEGDRFGNGRSMRNLFEDSVLRQAQRLNRPGADAEALSVLTGEDLLADSSLDRAQALEEATAELDSLVGLEEIKEQVRGLQNLLALRHQRAESGLSNQEIGKHMVFLGPPGTGKTTVARIWAKMLYAMEQLPRPDLVEASSADLVAGYVGQTAIKTRQLVRQARGGVLFIDEAYTLANNSSFAGEALAELVKLMEDERSNLVVILAGYEQEMKNMLELNPGMSSRVAHTLHFPAYSAEELMQVCQSMIQAAHYKLSEKAIERAQELCGQIAGLPKERGGNAREVRRMVEAALIAQASRLSGGQASRAQLEIIEAEDISWESNTQQHQVGFAPS